MGGRLHLLFPMEKLARTQLVKVAGFPGVSHAVNAKCEQVCQVIAKWRQSRHGASLSRAWSQIGLSPSQPLLRPLPPPPASAPGPLPFSEGTEGGLYTHIYIYIYIYICIHIMYIYIYVYIYIYNTHISKRCLCCMCWSY